MRKRLGSARAAKVSTTTPYILHAAYSRQDIFANVCVRTLDVGGDPQFSSVVAPRWARVVLHGERSSSTRSSRRAHLARSAARLGSRAILVTKRVPRGKARLERHTRAGGEMAGVGHTNDDGARAA